MHAKKTIKILDESNKDSLKKPRGAILLACLSPDDDPETVVHILEDVSQRLRFRVKIFLALDDLVPIFMEKYGFEGTPSYVLIQKDRPPEYMFGDISEHNLFRFIDHKLIKKVARGKP